MFLKKKIVIQILIIQKLKMNKAIKEILFLDKILKIIKW